MSKNMLLITINSNYVKNSYEVEGTIDNNIISFIEPDTNSKTVFNIEKETISRSNNELDMIYDFQKGIGYVFVRDLKNRVDLNIKVLEKNINASNIYIKYSINDEEFKYKIEVK